MNNTFTVAHISDLHLTASHDDARSEAKIFGKLTGMNDNLRILLSDKALKNADAIVVTGDITDRGHLIEWEYFWKSIEKEGLSSRAMIIPGNHDVCCLGLRRLRPKAEDRARARAGLGMGDQEVEFPWVRLFDRNIAFFALDSSNAGNTSVLDNAVGQIGLKQLTELGRLLLLYSHVPYKFIILHHSPNIPYTKTSRRHQRRPHSFWERKSMQLDTFDRRALRMLAAIFRVKAILHGHTHDSLDRRIQGVRLIGTNASTEPDGNSCLHYKLYTLYTDSSTLRVRTRKVPIAFNKSTSERG